MFGHTQKTTQQTDIILTLTPHIIRVLDLNEADLDRSGWDAIRWRRPGTAVRARAAEAGTARSSAAAPPPAPAAAGASGAADDQTASVVGS